MEYLDFDLEIGLGGRLQYPLSVRSPAGETRGTLNFPFIWYCTEVHSYDDFFKQFRSVDVNPPSFSQEVQSDQQIGVEDIFEQFRSFDINPASSSQEMQPAQQMGTDLFNALFVGEILSLYNVSKRIANEQDKGLRIRLRIQPSELSAFPWEYLYDPHAYEYLSLSIHTPLVRYIEVNQPVRPIKVDFPLRILGMVCSPSDLAQINIADEKRHVEDALKSLRNSGMVELVWLQGETWSDLQEILLETQWHVFHFIGHGGFNAERDEGYLLFTGTNGKSHQLFATELARLLADHKGLRLVLLNACQSARSSYGNIFSSTASVLVRRGIACSIAMQFLISDESAVSFAKCFYTMIAKGLPVDSAITEARKALSISEANSVEWGTPVLFMRSPNGVLFDAKVDDGFITLHKTELHMDIADRHSASQPQFIPHNINLLQIYGAKTVEDLLIEHRWESMPDMDGLLPFPVPIGGISELKPLRLWLAENRDGPHGIVAGTARSGRTELLRTLICALAIEHHPYLLNFLLIDFENGNAYKELRDLPHNVGMIVNPDRSSALKTLEAIKQEVIRRQSFLANHSEWNILRYHKKLAKKSGFYKSDPLPHLFIFINEFAHLEKDMPDFIPELKALLRVGRALGLHLILATQYPMGKVNNELRSNLNCRICLRVNTLEESLEVLRRRDAASIDPTLPGRAYFQLGDGGNPLQFQSAQVSITYCAENPNQSLLSVLVQEMRNLFGELKARDGLCDLPKIILD